MATKRFQSIKLHLSLSFVFTMLISASIAIIIVFTYFRTSAAMMESAKEAIDQASSVIAERTSSLMGDVDEISKTTLGVFPPNTKEVSLENKAFVDYLFSVVKSYPFIYGHYIGTKEGSFLQVVNLKASGRNTFLTKPDQFLPKNLDLAIRFIDRREPKVTETWLYLSAGREVLAQEVLEEVSYDPRKRPWYQQAERDKELTWTGVYQYASLVGQGAAASGITAAQPVLRGDQGLIAVIGTDITLNALSDFISEQRIALSGKAFILDKEGKIIVPFEKHLMNYPDWYSKELLQIPFASYQSDQKKTFSFSLKETFLAHLVNFPITGGNHWYILFIVPSREFLLGLIQTQKIISGISVGILMIAIAFVYLISRRISKPICVLAEEVDKIKHFDLSSDLRVPSRIGEVALLDESIASMRSALRSFTSYVPKEIVKALIEEGGNTGLGGAHKEATILFTDVVGFTSIVEDQPTEIIMNMLAEYFYHLSEIIISHEGTIDKYIGDSIMSFWGAPTEVDDPNIKACVSALLCAAFVKEFNEKKKGEKKPTFETKFGLDYGPVIVGNIGTLTRMNYTAMGDTVNIASRLEKMAGQYGATVLVTENVVSRLDHQFHVRPVDYLAVKGKKVHLNVYELMGKKEGEGPILLPPEKIQLVERFTEAYHHYQNKEIDQAKKLFLEAQQIAPDDIPTKTYLEKIEKGEIPLD